MWRQRGLEPPTLRIPLEAKRKEEEERRERRKEEEKEERAPRCWGWLHH